MSSKMPPVPSASQSQKGTGDAREPQADQSEHNRHIANDTEKQGQQGSATVNTTHQGHQQDR